MLQAVWSNFESYDPSYEHSTTQYLKKHDLRDFLSILFDTTIARTSSGHYEQCLEVYYGTLILFMIRFVLFLAFRYSKYDYAPLDHQASHDPTFLKGPDSQLYHPMLLLLHPSISKFERGNTYFARAAEAVHSIPFKSSSSPPPNSMSMYNYALRFISHFTRDCYTPRLIFPGVD